MSQQSRQSTPTIPLGCAAASALLLLVGLVVVTFGGEVRGLFETADAEVDTVSEEGWTTRSSRPAARHAPARASDAAWAPAPTPEPRPARDGWLSSTYVGGDGARDRLAHLVDEGQVVGDEELRLESLTASYHQPVGVPSGQALALFASTEHRAVVAGGGVTHLQVGVQATSTELARRPDLQLVLVVDTSGSMQEEGKMEHARAAALALVDELEPGDRLAIVAYSDEAVAALPMTRRGDGEAARRAIEQLDPGGHTNIHAALTVAYELMGSDEDGAVRRVLLISDGRPTAGMGDPAAIRRVAWQAFQQGVQTTTVGVGLDFGAELMIGIAADGEGNYHFLADAASITDVLHDELVELTQVVAKAVRLTIHLDERVELERVLGADVLSEAETAQVRAEEQQLDQRIAEELGIVADRQVEPPDEGLKLAIPTMHAGRHHVVMLRVRVPPGTGEREVARVELRYKDLVARTNGRDEQRVTVEVADDREAMVASLDRATKKNLLGFRTGEAMLAASDAVERGRSRDAIERVDDQMTLLAVASERWRDPDLQADAVLLGRYKDALVADAAGRLDWEARAYLARSLSYGGYRLTR